MSVNPSSIVPSPKQAVVTPNDSADLPTAPTRGIILTNAATLAYVDADGNSVTFPFPAGQFSISIRRILATGTTASAGEILALY